MTAARPLVVVIGAGPAGLTAAAELAGSGICDTLVLEREETAGGIPRHTHHTGFGVRDLRRVLSGPTYARRLTDRAVRNGAQILTSAMATGWSAEGALEVTSPQGRVSIRPDAVVLCTGCRERSRAARLIPGSRPQGIMTTGTLQQLVHLQGLRTGHRAVIIGAEHVSYSALATLAQAGASVAAILTHLPKHQSYQLFAIGARLRYRTPTLVNTEVARIHGYPHLEGVTVQNVLSGATTEIACDLLLLTGDWIPDNELAVAAAIPLDHASGAPLIDTVNRTLRPQVFAAGNVVHPAETADVAALGGQHAAASVVRFFRTGCEWPSPATRIVSTDLSWVTPQLVPPDRSMPSRARLIIRARDLTPIANLTITQGRNELWSGRARLIPNRSASLRADWLTETAESDDPIEVRVAGGPRRPS